jgi:hypothetical protein
VDLQRGAAFVCAVVGLAILAGIGWALMLAAVLLFVSPQSAVTRRMGVRAGLSVKRVWRWLLTGRQRIAAALVPPAVLALAVGIGWAINPGWGIATGALTVLGLSLVADHAE